MESATSLPEAKLVSKRICVIGLDLELGKKTMLDVRDYIKGKGAETYPFVNFFRPVLCNDDG